jgi:hypothetical protein
MFYGYCEHHLYPGLGDDKAMGVASPFFSHAFGGMKTIMLALYLENPTRVVGAT